MEGANAPDPSSDAVEVFVLFIFPQKLLVVVSRKFKPKHIRTGIFLPSCWPNFLLGRPTAVIKILPTWWLGLEKKTETKQKFGLRKHPFPSE